MIVKSCEVPLQPLADGVTVIVAVFIALALFVAVNEAISPAPLAGNPIAVLLFVQLLTVPATELLKLIAEVVVLLHNVWSDTDATSGVGLTVIVKLCGVPEHTLTEGVTVIVAVIAALVLLVPVNEAILPVPLDASPIEGSLFVQL